MSEYASILLGGLIYGALCGLPPLCFGIVTQRWFVGVITLLACAIVGMYTGVIGASPVSGVMLALIALFAWHDRWNDEPKPVEAEPVRAMSSAPTALDPAVVNEWLSETIVPPVRNASSYVDSPRETSLTYPGPIDELHKLRRQFWEGLTWSYVVLGLLTATMVVVNHLMFFRPIYELLNEKARARSLAQILFQDYELGFVSALICSLPLMWLGQACGASVATITVTVICIMSGLVFGWITPIPVGFVCLMVLALAIHLNQFALQRLGRPTSWKIDDAEWQLWQFEYNRFWQTSACCFAAISLAAMIANGIQYGYIVANLGKVQAIVEETKRNQREYDQQHRNPFFRPR